MRDFGAFSFSSNEANRMEVQQTGKKSFFDLCVAKGQETSSMGDWDAD